MKVLMFSDKYGSVTTTFIRNEVEYFISRHEIVYVTQEVEANIEGVRIYKLPYIEKLISRKLRWNKWQKDRECTFVNAKYGKELNFIIEKEKPDVIHCHFAYEAIKIIQNINSENKTPIFIHFHGYGASQMLRKKSYVQTIQACLKKENVYPLFVSNYIKETLRNLSIDVSKGSILRCGVDLDKFYCSSIVKEEGEIVFLQVSSLAEKKGHEYTIKSFDMFLTKNKEYRDSVKVVFTGDGARKEGLVRLVSKLNLDKNIEFIGNVTSDKAVVLMNSADFYVHHSVESSDGDKEGIPTSVMEAMAMNLPILSTNHAGIPELVKHEVNGLLCDEKDIETFSTQIKEILSWGKLNKNRDKVEKLYNYKIHNLQLEKLYGEKSK